MQRVGSRPARYATGLCNGLARGEPEPFFVGDSIMGAFLEGQNRPVVGRPSVQKLPFDVGAYASFQVTSIVSCFETAPPAVVSLTWTVKAKTPLVNGLPPMCPPASVNPAGRTPLSKDHP